MTTSPAFWLGLYCSNWRVHTQLADSCPISWCFVKLFQEDFWTDPARSIAKAYERTDQAILSHSPDLGRGGSTAVTAILIDGCKLWIANIGDSRAVLSRRGEALQLSVDHEPSTERGSIEDRGGFVSNMPGNFYYVVTDLLALALRFSTVFYLFLILFDIQLKEYMLLVSRCSIKEARRGCFGWKPVIKGFEIFYNLKLYLRQYTFCWSVIFILVYQTTKVNVLILLFMP